MEPNERAQRAVSGDPMVGRLLDGRYLIGPRIARGGMAGVYEATDTRLDRTVAVKVMHAGLGDDDEFSRRFVREARAAARLNHPHVVAVHDQGDDDGTLFLVMEFVPGHTLRDVIRKEAPMAPLRALSLLEPVVSALAAAHRAGLIHRDVKPENVLLADVPTSSSSVPVKVADFGLAKAVSGQTQHTATGGVLIGTVSYLAPELVVDGTSDARADVYAAGVVLYELLTGTKPHEGESPIQVAYSHVHNDVPSPSAAVPGITDYVDALVARATSRDPSQRPADAGVLLHHVHLVMQALRDGLESDPELTADLAPRPAPTDAYADENTTQAFDAEALALLTEVPPAESGLHDDGAVDRTTALERHAIEPAAPPAPRPSRAPSKVTAVSTTARRRSRRGPLVLLLALLLAAGVGVGAWWFGWARYTTTPSVLGLEEATAIATLKDAGLKPVVGDPAFSENVAAGLVISTDPTPGGKVLDSGTVTMVLSLGPERYDVPRLRGMTEDEAQDALAETNLAFGKSEEKWHETVPEGQVIRSTPKAGTTLKPEATVDLVISKGRRPIEVADWTGKSFERAEAALEKRGLVTTVTGQEYSDDVPEGGVISQSPASGTLYRGDTVSFVVSRGPELVEVPRTIAMGVDAATERLEALGFEVEVERSDNYIGVGFVYRSDPSAGTMAPKGSTITLYLI